MRHIILTDGYSSLVDDEDYNWLNQHKWHVYYGSKTNYASRQYRYTTGETTTLRMAIEILKYHNRYDGNLITDHQDRNGLNNQKYNLRMVTKQINNINQNLRDNNTSGFRGVSQHGDRWRSMITVNDKQIHIGVFDTKIKAALAYNRIAIVAFGKDAVLNVIDFEEKM